MSRITNVSGRALPLRGDDVDTDRIIPARYLKSITFEGLERHLFADDRASSSGHPVDDPRYTGATVLVVGRNFGCGSSREHAPQAIFRRGIRAVVGESFSEIFFGNSVAIGMPCVRLAREDVTALMTEIERDPLTEIGVDLESQVVRAGAREYRATLPESARQAFLSGEWDGTALLLERPEELDRVAASLPYIDGFRL